MKMILMPVPAHLSQHRAGRLTAGGDQIGVSKGTHVNISKDIRFYSTEFDFHSATFPPYCILSSTLVYRVIFQHDVAISQQFTPC